MRKLFLLFIVLFIMCSAFGQSSSNPFDDTGVIKFRPDHLKEFKDLDKLIGYWISLDGEAFVKISKRLGKINLEGDYFPGINKNGDNAELSILTISDKSRLMLWYTLKERNDNGAEVPIMYSTNDLLLIGEEIPYYEFKDGEWWQASPTQRSSGIKGKEFKRMK